MSRTKRQRHADAQERLKRENDRLRPELAERERQLDEAAKQIADAKKQIADLERQLALREQNSTTTSKPPALLDRVCCAKKPFLGRAICRSRGPTP